MERNSGFGGRIADALKERGIIAELAASNCVAEWAYAQTEAARGLTWLKADQIKVARAGRANSAVSTWREGRYN